LFQKFHRLESSDPQEGLGLGLYIVKELVTAHGGRIEVESAIGRQRVLDIFAFDPDLAWILRQSPTSFLPRVAGEDEGGSDVIHLRAGGDHRDPERRRERNPGQGKRVG
jgi:signal transduction histidine kinase